MFRKFIGEKYFCGLDIGPQTIKAGIIEPKEGRQFELHGVYEVKTEGFEGGSVTDMGELSSSIHDVLTGLSKNTRIRIKAVQLGMGGEIVRKRLGNAAMPLLDRGTRIISKKDVAKVQEHARLLGIKMDEILLQDFPQIYKVDDVNRALNPVGLYGRKLEAETLVAVVNSTIFKNLVKAVNQAGYDVENVFFTTHAAARTALDHFQKKQGCIFVDVSSFVTDIALFQSGEIRFLDSIPLGGQDMTRAVSAALNVSVDMAEDIKRSYAVVRHRHSAADEEILIKAEDGYLPVKKGVITESVEPVVSDLVNMLRASLKRSGAVDCPAAGMVMAGGGALLSGLAERLEEDLGMPVKMAKIHFVSRRMHNAAKFLSAVGLAHAGFDRNFGLLTKQNHGSHWLKGCLERAKEIYEEYF